MLKLLLFLNFLFLQFFAPISSFSSTSSSDRHHQFSFKLGVYVWKWRLFVW